MIVDDARRSFADIGARVGLSASAVKRRVDRLRAGGAITGFTERWAGRSRGKSSCTARCAPPQATIRAAVQRFPEVADASTVSGAADAVLRILAVDMRHFEQVLEHIGAEPFVARTKSVLVLSPLIRRRAAPHPPRDRRTGTVCGPWPAPGTEAVIMGAPSPSPSRTCRDQRAPIRAMFERG